MAEGGAALSWPGRLIVTALLGSGERHAVYLSPNTRSSLTRCWPPAVGAAGETTTGVCGSGVTRRGEIEDLRRWRKEAGLRGQGDRRGMERMNVNKEKGAASEGRKRIRR